MFYILEIPAITDLLAVTQHYFEPDNPNPNISRSLYRNADAILCTALRNIDEEDDDVDTCDYPPSLILAAEYVIDATRRMLNTSSIGGFTIIDDTGSVAIEL